MSHSDRGMDNADTQLLEATTSNGDCRMSSEGAGAGSKHWKRESHDRTSFSSSHSTLPHTDYFGPIFFSKTWITELEDLMKDKDWQLFEARGSGRKVFQFEQWGLSDIPVEQDFPLYIVHRTCEAGGPKATKEDSVDEKKTAAVEATEELKVSPEDIKETKDGGEKASSAEETKEDALPVKKVAYISPDDQCPPKKRGRKPKQPDGDGESQPKAKAKPKSKAKAKAKAKALAKKKKAEEEREEEEEDEDANESENEGEDEDEDHDDEKQKEEEEEEEEEAPEEDVSKKCKKESNRKAKAADKEAKKDPKHKKGKHEE